MMTELKKVKRVLGKQDTTAPHHILLVIDAAMGQNVLTQTQQFHEALHLAGLIVTKLDGTAKGGMLFNLAQRFSLPIYFVGMVWMNMIMPFNKPCVVAAY